MERAIAERGRFPAINVLKSISRTMPGCQTPLERETVTRARRSTAAYASMEELIRIGAYRAGSDADIDHRHHPQSRAGGFPVAGQGRLHWPCPAAFDRLDAIPGA